MANKMNYLLFEDREYEVVIKEVTYHIPGNVLFELIEDYFAKFSGEYKSGS